MDDRAGTLATLNDKMQKEDAGAPHRIFKLGFNDNNLLFSCDDDGFNLLKLCGCYDDDSERLRFGFDYVADGRFILAPPPRGNALSPQVNKNGFAWSMSLPRRRVHNADAAARNFRMVEVEHMITDGRVVLLPDTAEMRPPILRGATRRRAQAAAEIAAEDTATAEQPPERVVVIEADGSRTEYTAAEYHAKLDMLDKQAAPDQEHSEARIADVIDTDRFLRHPYGVSIHVIASDGETEFNIPPTMAARTMASWISQGFEC